MLPRSPNARAGSTLRYVVLPYLALVALKLALAWPLDTPLKGDELVYLGNARQLATGSGLVDPAGRGVYKIGYSLALVPAFLVDDDPIGGFKAAQVTNAFLLSLVYPAAFLLAGRLRRDLAPLDRMLAALCVGLYPAAVLYATTAMSANAFLPAYFGFALAAAAVATRPATWSSWAALGGAAVYLYAIHERAIGILALAVLAAAVGLVWGRRRQPLALLAAAGVGLGLVRWLEVPGSRWKTGSRSASFLDRALADPEALAVTFSGQLWYLGLATFGVLFLGTLFLFARPRELASRWTVPPVFWLLLYGSAGSVFALSVLFMAQRGNARFTHWIYGRYNEGVLLPLFLVALVALYDAGKRGQRRRLVASAAGAAAALLALSGVLALAWTPKMGPPFSFNASSSTLFYELYRWGGVAGAGILAAVCVLVAALFAVRWRWAAGLLAALLALSTAITYERSWTQRYASTEDQRRLVELIRRIDPERRVIYVDRKQRWNHFHYYQATYHLSDFVFEPLNPKKLRRKTRRGDLALSPRLDLAERYPGARLVGLENFAARSTGYVQGLWVLPGPLAERLEARGWLLPAAFPAPLPAAALDAEIRPVGEPPRRLRRGAATPLALELVHRGDLPWPHRGGLRRTQDSVRLLVRWLRAGDGESAAEAARHWLDLPRMLYPGEEARVRGRLRAERALPLGRYRVTIAVAQDRDRQPAAIGGGALELELEVVETRP